MPGRTSKALLSDTLKTSKWRSMIAANLLLHYPKAADTFGDLDANVRSRALGHLSAILTLNGLYDADALAAACPARGRAGCVRLQHHGRRALLRRPREAHHRTHREVGRRRMSDVVNDLQDAGTWA